MSDEFSYDRIIFYDGECGFCNSTVQFILKKRSKDFYFVSLQSDKAKKLLEPHSVIIEVDTIYYLKQDILSERSNAALRILRDIKGLYPLLQIFYLIPRFLRDAIYNSIAKRRHRIRKGFCLTLQEEEKKYFLDE